MFNNLKEVDIMRKENNDLVTSVDFRVEEELDIILLKLLPNSLFVGEEKFSQTPNILNNYNKKKYNRRNNRYTSNNYRKRRDNVDNNKRIHYHKNDHDNDKLNVKQPNEELKNKRFDILCDN